MSDLIAHSMRRRRSFGFQLTAVAAFLVAMLALLALGARAQAAPLSKADQEFVETTIEESRKAEKQPGVSVAITGPKGEFTKAFGVGYWGPETPLSLNDHFRVGSLTKPFTATAILKQIEKGKLKFTDTLDQFVKEIPYGKEITVRDLLSMRSGVYEFEADSGFSISFALNPTMNFGPQDAVKIIRKHEAYSAPGKKTEYSNSNYVLLGLILEQVSGETAEAAITKEVIKPLGLEQTTFPAPTVTEPIPWQLPATYAHGYNPFLGTLRESTNMNARIPWTAGAIVSTIGDLSKFAQAQDGSTLLSPTMQEERLKFCPNPYSYEGPTEYGYGLGLFSLGTWLGHSGSVPGYESVSFYEPATGATIAVMANLQTTNVAAWTRIFEKIAVHLYPGSMATPKYPKC